jgi:hypothetical protein
MNVVVAIFIIVLLTCYVFELEQRIRIEDIRNDEWFKKNYEPIREVEDEELNLDDVNAAFNDPQVYSYIHHFPRVHLDTMVPRHHTCICFEIVHT